MRKWFIIAVLSALGGGTAVLAAASGWSEDFDKSLKKAEKAGKPLLVEFTVSDASETCRKLEKEVFWKGAFKSWARKNVVLVQVDFPKQRFQSVKRKAAAAELKRRYKVDALPTVLVLRPDGAEVGRVGYVEGGPEKWIGRVKPLVEAAAGMGEWVTRWDRAQALSRATNKPILADFTGSDWCGWCKKLKAEVFETPDFKEWAKKHVILLEVDFPRTIEQPAELKKQNAELQRKYAIRGYPTVLFLDHKGNVLHRSGYKRGGPGVWIADADHHLK
jgi:thioredoxin-related protein